MPVSKVPPPKQDTDGLVACPFVALSFLFFILLCHDRVLPVGANNAQTTRRVLLGHGKALYWTPTAEQMEKNKLV